MTPEGRLAGRVAIVTGAASGFGEATARRFHAEGGRIVVADAARAFYGLPADPA
jgi:NAD(P)-dependent dehydrogenase (short-subunit alcohol dehydrogenase family)